MNKIMLVVLLLICSLGCIVWSVETPATTPVATPLPKTKVNPIDGAEMVLIPAGEFMMGTSEEQLAVLLKANPTYQGTRYINEMPQRKVELNAYYMYKTEVTVAQYRKFCEMTQHKMPPEPDWKWQDTHPVVNVTWHDAMAYTDWAGATLPTEAQWEKAARGIDGRVYPWGNDWDATNSHCSKVKLGDVGKTASVGSFPTGASPYGVLDMAGNVGEWCADWYFFDYYLTGSVKNPIGPEAGTFRVLRGTEWKRNNPYYHRAAFRFYKEPDYMSNSIGFRCSIKIAKSTISTPTQLHADTPTTTPVAAPLQVMKVNPKDGSEMMLIPAGEFLMGSTDDVELAQDNEKPQRKVYLDEYYIYKNEVTVAQYRKFCEATKRKMPKEPDYWKWWDSHPMVNVFWFDAKDYADWAGAALPTEAQWEKAARGTDGRIYPWGNDWDARKCSSSLTYEYQGKTASVGSFPKGASPYGVMDMAGNVWEWCSDWYGKDYYKTSPVNNPTGPVTGTERVRRSGSWSFNNSNLIRTAYRSYCAPNKWYYLMGFRCALNIENNTPPKPAIGTDNISAQSKSSITLLSPNGSEKWQRNSTQIINWKSKGKIENVKIELYKAGVFKNIIAENVANTGSYTWTISTGKAAATDYSVKISAIEDANVTGQSAANFAITQSPYNAPQ